MTEQYQHRARKRFGQNFLHDAGIIDRILRAINAKPGEHLLEIGPGQGALTEGLLGSGAQLDVVELDKDLVPILQHKFADRDNFRLHQGDALKFDFNQLGVPERSLKVVGNLPYNISTPLIFHLLEHANLIRDMHFMLQRKWSSVWPPARRRRLGPPVDHGAVPLPRGTLVQRRPWRLQPAAESGLSHRPPGTA